MPSSFSIVSGHMAGGTNLAAGIYNVKKEQNIEAKHMTYTPEGEAVTDGGYADIGIDWGENGAGIDGMYVMSNYPTLLWVAVNGKIKYADLSTEPESAAVVYEADPAIVLTAGNPVFFRDYRGTLYFTNGVEDMGRIAVGQLYSALANPASTYQYQSLRDSDWAWTASGSGTNEYYVRTATPSNPNLVQPVSLRIDGGAATEGTVGSLTAGQWDYGDNDALGYSTIYVRLSDGADPDSKAIAFVEAELRAIFLDPGDGDKFTDGVDKVYVEGDEVDYNFITLGTAADKLVVATNVATTHAANAYVTQYNTITAPTSGSLKARCLAIFRDTMFYIPVNEPNVLRYGKTVSSVSTFANIHDFSDGNNYLIGSAGELTGLLDSGQDRLYVFTKDKTYYIGIEITSGAVEAFSPDRLFTGNYGCPNPFCVAEMEGVVVVFTGKRIIRFGYEPTINQILPDEKFDEEIFPVLTAAADYDQANSRVVYSSRNKKLLLTINLSGILRTAVYDNRLDKYSYSFDFDPSSYAIVSGALYFGSRDADVVYKFGEDIDADGTALEHALVTGRLDNKSRNRKFWRRGVVEGRLAIGTAISFSIRINGETVGTIRQITDEVADLTRTDGAVGSDIVGMTTVGGGVDTVPMYKFRFPFSIGQRGEDIQFEWSSITEGAAWSIAKWQVDGVEFEELPYTHY